MKSKEYLKIVLMCNTVPKCVVNVLSDNTSIEYGFGSHVTISAAFGHHLRFDSYSVAHAGRGSPPCARK